MYLLDWQDLIGPALTLLLFVGGPWFIYKYLKRGAEERRRASRSARLQSGTVGRARDSLHGQSDGQLEIHEVATDQSDGSDFFAERQQRKQARARSNLAANVTVERHEDKTDQGLDEWFEREQANLSPADDGDQSVGGYLWGDVSNLAADPLVQAWARDSDTDLHDLGKRPEDEKLAAAYDHILAKAEHISKESDDLDFIIRKLETSVDFISAEFSEAVDQWKKGEAHRRSTLDDLKHRFRLKTFSLDDAWELFFTYPDWLNKQRKALVKFAAVLGAEAETGETFAALINRAEKSEWARDLDVNMDVVFLFKELRQMDQVLSSMAVRLQNLEKACNKRSGQVISPSWEPQKLQL